jgi:hypothetical protein
MKYIFFSLSLCDLYSFIYVFPPCGILHIKPMETKILRKIFASKRKEVTS